MLAPSGESGHGRASSAGILAGLLESAAAGEGEASPVLSRRVREEGLDLRRAYESLPESERTRFARTFSPELLQEIFSLSQESDASLFYQGLHDLGLRLSRGHRPELAMLFFSGIAQTLEQEFPGRPADHAALASRARRELDALMGRGAIMPRVEHLLRGVAQEASNPVMLASMGVAGFAFSTVRMGMLSRLLASSSGGAFTRGFGARALASTAGFVAEVPAFVFSGRGLNEALGHRQDWSWGAMGRDLATAGITLSALKLSGWGARSLMGRMEGSSALAGFSRAALPQAATLGGLMLGHRMEEGLGLRPHVDGATTFVDSLSTLLVFHVSGRLLHHAMGPNYAALQREMELRSQVLARTPRPRGETGDRPPLADLLGGMFSMHQPALAGAGVREGRGPRPFRLPHILMMSMNGEGEGGGRRSSSPPSVDDGVTTVQRPISPRPLSTKEAEQLGRADTIMREPEVPAAKPEVERSPETVSSEVDPKTQAMPPAGDPVVEALRPPPLPREAVGGAKETEIEIAPDGGQTGVYDPQQLQAARAAATTAPLDPTNLIPGNRLGREGRYEVVRRLGGGGMGDVWEVIDRELGRQAVIKIPKAGLFKPEDLRRFDREVKIGANLDVRFVVPVYDIIELVPGGLRVPVMRYVPGRDLHSILYGVTHENPEMLRDFPPERRLELFAKLCEAVESIHEDGIVHRDLKPANVRITPEGNVLLMDFGLAKRQADGANGHDSDAPDSPRSRLSIPIRTLQAENITQAGVWQGTVGYIAPETIFSKPIQNFRSPDIFALGVMLYETMTGLHPFANYRNGDPALGEPARVPEREVVEVEGQRYERTVFNMRAPILWSQPELAAKINPPSFREILQDTQPEFFYELEAVARRAFHPDPAQRYQSARELVQAVYVARGRGERIRLDALRARMSSMERRLQDLWHNFNIGSRLSPEQWDAMQQPIQELRHMRAQWRQGYDDLVTTLIRNTKGDPLPEARKFIAEVSWERLVEGGDRLEQVEREALERQIREFDLPTSEDPHASMRSALEGTTRISLIGSVLHDGRISAGLRLNVAPLRRERDASGRELNNYRLGEPLLAGSLEEIGDRLALPAGYYVFGLSHPDYAPMNVPVRIGLRQVRQGILEGRPLELELQFVPKETVPEDMVVVHSGNAVLGHDYYHDGPPTNVYAPPMRERFFPTFLISREPIVIGEKLRDENNQIRGNGYRAFIEHLLEEGRYNDALQFLPRVKVNPTGDEPFTMPEFFKMIRGVGWKASIQRLRETLSGTHHLWKIRVEGRGKKVRYVLEDPITDFSNPASNRDPEGDPILPRQPISSITANAAEEYIRWRSARDGRTYRLPHPDEMEKATRGSFPLTYPWGYDFNPNFLASRMAHKGIEDCFPHPVGEHPLGEAWSRDRSIYGLVEPLGNIREFVQAPDNLPNLIGLFGGSIRVPYGPFFLPAARVYQNRTAAEDGIGSLRLILDLPPPDQESR